MRFLRLTLELAPRRVSTNKLRAARKSFANISRSVAGIPGDFDASDDIIRRIYSTFFRSSMPTESESQRIVVLERIRASETLRVCTRTRVSVDCYPPSPLPPLCMCVATDRVYTPVTQFWLLAREFIWVHPT